MNGGMVERSVLRAHWGGQLKGYRLIAIGSREESKLAAEKEGTCVRGGELCYFPSRSWRSYCVIQGIYDYFNSTYFVKGRQQTLMHIDSNLSFLWFIVTLHTWMYPDNDFEISSVWDFYVPLQTFNHFEEASSEKLKRLCLSISTDIIQWKDIKITFAGTKILFVLLNKRHV